MIGLETFILRQVQNNSDLPVVKSIIDDMINQPNSKQALHEGVRSMRYLVEWLADTEARKAAGSLKNACIWTVKRGGGKSRTTLKPIEHYDWDKINTIDPETRDKMWKAYSTTIKKIEEMSSTEETRLVQCAWCEKNLISDMSHSISCGCV